MYKHTLTFDVKKWFTISRMLVNMGVQQIEITRNDNEVSVTWEDEIQWESEEVRV